MERHLAVSQFPSYRATHRHDFRARNVTMALIADAVVIADSREMGGTRSMAWASHMLKRPLYLAPHLLESSDLKWPRLQVLSQRAKIVRDVEEILRTK